jgi:hypothetical protein
LMLFDGLSGNLMQKYGDGLGCQTLRMMVFDVSKPAGFLKWTSAHRFL